MKPKYDPMVYHLAAAIVTSAKSASPKTKEYYDKYTCVAVSRVSPKSSDHVSAYQRMFQPRDDYELGRNGWWNGPLSFRNQVARGIALDLAALMAEEGTL